MRHVTKNSAGASVVNKKAAPVDRAAAETAWKNFKNKDKLLDHLLAEQYHLCCYTEIRADLLGLGYHNEHIQPKSKFPAKTFDYANLAASALASDPDLKFFGKGKEHESFGGAYKEDNWGAKFISPHQSDAGKFFVFDKNGNINPATGLTPMQKKQAEYTITLLNLRCPYLTDARRGWWSKLEQAVQKTAEKNIGQLIASYFSLDDGKLDPFFSVTRQFFGAAAEQYLTKHAPHLL